MVITKNFIAFNNFSLRPTKSKISTWLFIMGTATLTINQVRPFPINTSLPNTLYLLAGVFVFVEWLVSKEKSSKWIPSHPMIIPACLILFGGIISSFKAYNLSSSLGITLKEAFIFSIWISIGIRTVKEGWTENIINILIFGAVFSSLVAITDFLFGTSFSRIFVSQPVGTILDITTLSRFGGSMGHPNEQGMFLGVVFPLVLDSIIRNFKSKGSLIKSFLFIFSITIIFWGALIAGSVTGYLGMLVSSIVIIIGYKRIYKLLRFFLFLSALCLLIFIILGNINLDKLPNKATESLNNSKNLARVIELSGPERVVLMKEGVTYIISSPIIGAGMDQSGTGEIDPDKRVTSFYIHNTILQAWVAGGLFTFLGTLIIYFQSAKLALIGTKAAIKRKAYPYILALSASTLGFIIMDMAQPNIYQRFKWLIVALLYGLLITKNNSRLR